MAKQSISDMVWSMALPIVEEAGCELVDVEFLKEGSDWFCALLLTKTRASAMRIANGLVSPE